MSAIIPINQEMEIPDEQPYGSDLYPSDYDRLTWQQKRFVDAYVGEAKGVAYKAAIIAGYGDDYKSTTSIATRLLQHPSVIACVRAAAKAVMSEHETISHLAGVIRAPASDMAMNAKVKALELMMRYHGVLIDKHEMSGTVQQEIKQIVVTYAAQTEREEREKTDR